MGCDISTPMNCSFPGRSGAGTVCGWAAKVFVGEAVGSWLVDLFLLGCGFSNKSIIPLSANRHQVHGDIELQPISALPRKFCPNQKPHLICEMEIEG